MSGKSLAQLRFATQLPHRRPIAGAFLMLFNVKKDTSAASWISSRIFLVIGFPLGFGDKHQCSLGERSEGLGRRFMVLIHKVESTYQAYGHACVYDPLSSSLLRAIAACLALSIGYRAIPRVQMHTAYFPPSCWRDN